MSRDDFISIPANLTNASTPSVEALAAIEQQMDTAIVVEMNAPFDEIEEETIRLAMAEEGVSVVVPALEERPPVVAETCPVIPEEDPSPTTEILDKPSHAKSKHRHQRPGMSRAGKWIGGVVALVLILLLAVLGIDRYVVESSRARVVPVDSLSAEPAEAILVLGAGVRPDGSLSPMLRDRMEVGISLYQAGLGQVLLLSGDGGSPDYDEPAAMMAYALSKGVPQEAIVLDKGGFSTRESLARAKQQGGYRRLTVVSQTYHLYRALFMADRMGLEAVGVSADLQSYSGQLYREGREILARNKDFFLGGRHPEGAEEATGWISHPE